ncbi:uncharacterized protein TNCV_1000331 [Trichonephila clavipes]|nr:uncharacterized protein TNCV_1000331 [Trichonephila clavipes]
MFSGLQRHILLLLCNDRSVLSSVVNLQMIITFLGDIISLKQLSVFVKAKVRDDRGCNWFSYLDVLQLWLFPHFEENEPNNFIWQQDDAPYHWHLLVRDHLLVSLYSTSGLAAKSLSIKLVSHSLHVHPI